MGVRIRTLILKRSGAKRLRVTSFESDKFHTKKVSLCTDQRSISHSFSTLHRTDDWQTESLGPAYMIIPELTACVYLKRRYAFGWIKDNSISWLALGPYFKLGWIGRFMWSKQCHSKQGPSFPFSFHGDKTQMSHFLQLSNNSGSSQKANSHCLGSNCNTCFRTSQFNGVEMVCRWWA
jgi:hypothetical protein